MELRAARDALCTPTSSPPNTGSLIALDACVHRADTVLVQRPAQDTVQTRPSVSDTVFPFLPSSLFRPSLFYLVLFFGANVFRFGEKKHFDLCAESTEPESAEALLTLSRA